MTQRNLEMKKPKNWVKKEAPFEPFNKIGDTLEGLLLTKDKSTKYDFGLYSIKQFDGKQVKFHGSKQLDDLLADVTPPAYIKVIYVDNLEVSMGTMKVFEVYTGEN